MWRFPLIPLTNLVSGKRFRVGGFDNESSTQPQKRVRESAHNILFNMKGFFVNLIFIR